MQGVSSNYPDATAYTALGARNPDGKKYYRSAQDADKLNSVFNEIFDAVSTIPPLRPRSRTATMPASRDT